MTNSSMFNNMSGREQVKVLYISSLLVCTQHCRTTYLKPSKLCVHTRRKKQANDQKSEAWKSNQKSELTLWQQQLSRRLNSVVIGLGNQDLFLNKELLSQQWTDCWLFDWKSKKKTNRHIWKIWRFVNYLFFNFIMSLRLEIVKSVAHCINMIKSSELGDFESIQLQCWYLYFSHISCATLIFLIDTLWFNFLNVSIKPFNSACKRESCFWSSKFAQIFISIIEPFIESQLILLAWIKYVCFFKFFISIFFIESQEPWAFDESDSKIKYEIKKTAI